MDKAESSSSPAQYQLNLDPFTCPLCGGPNNCALAINPDATECWCDSVVVPRELLAQVPSDAVHRRCICKQCLEEHLKSTITPDSSQ